MNISLFFAFLFVVSVKGECGPPEELIHGTVKVRNDIARYRCDEELSTGDPNIRECVNGTWTGKIPQCVGFLNTEIEEPATGQDCFNISENGFVDVLFQEASVVAVAFKSDCKIWIDSDDPWPTISDGKGEIVEAINSKSRSWDNSNYMLKMMIKNEQRLSKIRLTANVNMFICDIRVIGVSLQCARPDAPLHGNVTWNAVNAYYNCDDGYTASSNATRTCFDGRWTGLAPTCVLSEPINSTIDSPTAVHVAIGSGWYIGIGIVGGIALLVIAGYVVYRKGLLRHSRQTPYFPPPPGMQLRKQHRENDARSPLEIPISNQEIEETVLAIE